MGRAIHYLLTIAISLLIFKNLSGQCPDRLLLLSKIDSLKAANPATDIQLKELLPNVHRLEGCPRPADSVFAFLLQRLGLLYYLKGDFPSAVNYTRRAIVMLEEKCPPSPTKPPFLVRCYFNLLIFYDSLHLRNEYLAAIDSCTSISLRTGAVDNRTLRALWEKAEYYYDVGDYDRCYKTELLGETLTQRYPPGKDSLAFVRNFSSVGLNSLYLMGRYGQLEDLLRQKIQESAKIADAVTLGPLMDLLSLVYTNKHDYKGALDCLQKSYAYSMSTHYQLASVQALNNTGYLYLHSLHDYNSALVWCRRALATLPEKRERGSFESLEALAIYDNIAGAYSAKGYPDSALAYFQLAFDQLQPGMNETVLLQQSPNQAYESRRIQYQSLLTVHKADAYYSHYLLTHDRKSLDESIRIYKLSDLFLKKAIGDQSEIRSQLAFRKNARDLYEHAIRASAAAGSADDAFYFFERSRAILLNDQLQKQANLDDRALAERAEIKKRILRLEKDMEGMSPDVGAYAELQTDLFAVKQKLDRYDQAVRKQVSSGRNFLFSTLPVLRARLERAQQSFFELYAGDSAVYSLLVSGQQTVLGVTDKSRFDSLARLYMNYISDAERLNRDMPGFVRTAEGLYRMLFKGGQAPGGRMVVSPDGSYFPFEALVTDGSVRHPVYFLDDHPVCYTYSARYFLDTTIDNAAAPAGKEFMGIAPVQYASYLRLPDLPGSNGSLDQIASWFSSPDKFTDAKASKASFLANYSGYRLIQLYTHAVGNNPGKEPLIYFADSALALSELIPEKKPLTRIIVLSACETANGEFYQGEGVFSFNREFAALGIPTAVVNCWSVDNKATYRLTELFYQYLSEGEPADIAMQKAKKEFFRSESGEQRLPYYWAAPVVTGQATLLPKSGGPFPWLYILAFPAAAGLAGYGINRRRRRKKMVY